MEPTSDYFSSQGRGIKAIFCIGTALLLAVLSLLAPRFIFPAFADLFQSFGAELPAITSFTFKYGGRVATLLLALVLAGGLNMIFSLQRDEKRQAKAYYLGYVLLGLSFLWCALIVAGCYAPIWAIGTVT